MPMSIAIGRLYLRPRAWGFRGHNPVVRLMRDAKAGQPIKDICERHASENCAMSGGPRLHGSTCSDLPHLPIREQIAASTLRGGPMSALQATAEG